VNYFFGYLWCLIAAGFAAGLTWALHQFNCPLWADVFIVGAVLPFYLLALVIYGGGFYHGYQQIFGSAKEANKEG
jgi:hypothetical protein